MLRYLRANLPRHEIAPELSVPVNTASTHIRSIYAKLQVSDRSSAVQMLIGSRAGSQQNERLSAIADSCGLPAGALRRARGSRRGGHSFKRWPYRSSPVAEPWRDSVWDSPLRIRRCGLGDVYGTMMSGTGEWRARPTATEPTMRCVAWDELPTMIATFSSGWASPMAVAPAIS